MKKGSAVKKSQAPKALPSARKKGAAPQKNKANPRMTVRMVKRIVSLDPLSEAAAADAGSKVQQLEEENRRLKAQLSDQRNSATMFAAPPAKPAKSYLGMAITFGIVAVLLAIVLLVITW